MQVDSFVRFGGRQGEEGSLGRFTYQRWKAFNVSANAGIAGDVQTVLKAFSSPDSKYRYNMQHVLYVSTSGEISELRWRYG